MTNENNTPPKPSYDQRVADLAFDFLNEWRVRAKFIAEDHGRHFPALVDGLATCIQEAIDQYMEDEIGNL